MRHNKNFNHLGRQAGHRKALMSNMASSLILHKRIETTVAKAKALRQFIEPLVTKSKEDTTHQRRMVFSYLKQKEAVTELFRTIAPKIAERPGGYTRILKTGFRLGDAADMCIIEFVDFNEAYTLGVTPAAQAVEAKPKTRRSRKPAAKKADAVEDAKIVEAKPKKVAAKGRRRYEGRCCEGCQEDQRRQEDVILFRSRFIRAILSGSPVCVFREGCRQGPPSVSGGRSGPDRVKNRRRVVGKAAGR